MSLTQELQLGLKNIVRLWVVKTFFEDKTFAEASSFK